MFGSGKMVNGKVECYTTSVIKTQVLTDSLTINFLDKGNARYLYERKALCLYLKILVKIN